MNLIRRLFGPQAPPHCLTCGDEMEPMSYVSHYRRDGTAVKYHGWHCPREPARSDRDRGSGYKHDCIPPYPLVNFDGKPPTQEAIDQNQRRWDAWNSHRPWQDVA